MHGVAMGMCMCTQTVMTRMTLLAVVIDGDGTDGVFWQGGSRC